MNAFLPARERSDIVNALKLYLTRVFWLGNPTSFIILIFLCADISAVISIKQALQHGGIDHALNGSLPSLFLYTEYATLILLKLYLTRQIKDSQSWSIPGLVKAETYAATIIYLCITTITSLMLTWAHFYFVNSMLFMLFNSIAATGLWYSPLYVKGKPIKKQDFIISLALSCVYILQLLLIFVHDLSRLILTCPPIVATLVDCALLVFIIRTMTTYPNRIYRNSAKEGADISEKAQHTFFNHENRKHKISAHELNEMLLSATRPRALWLDCAINLLTLPCFTLLLALVQYLISSGSLAADWAGMLASSVIFSTIGSSSVTEGGLFIDSWLTHRDHWLPIFVTGWFGTRNRFISAVFRAKLTRLIILTPLIVIGLIVPYAFCKQLSLEYALLLGGLLILLIGGSTCCTAIPFAITKAPPKWLTFAFALSPFMATSILNPLFSFSMGGSIAIVIILIIGIISFPLAGKRLVREDWVIEND